VRWEGLHHFEANLFRKRRIKFHQNRQSFVEDITKKKTFRSLFSLDTPSFKPTVFPGYTYGQWHNSDNGFAFTNTTSTTNDAKL